MPPPSLSLVFLVFTRISLSSFGGGLSGWIMREVVQRRRWMDEGEFLTGLALAQSFPGVNVVNLSIWIGYRLRGGAGALAGALGMIAPAACIAILVIAAFEHLAAYPLTHAVLAGIGAAAIGLSLQMGIRAARRVWRQPLACLVMIGTFLALFAFRLPLLPVMLVVAPLSIALQWRAMREAPDAR
ncbi:chromate transporter [Acetobacteraceae bacterium H6797]|nr:chromate transporter [Acetobacteraceae bacterium H6797]